ncbi:hypothetical protein CHGG_02009 [Chaetomium globosum CBS 148.51]|uniref:Protein kinase domain-containing protein n=1 Tax=Chaetomium globosum (strain ATCC 6205 / CBS 148.51 / DSM 1962 / NBRC 6347 / NRRL 1970) TaxID=306901 RepID=Q2HCP5_CHAGB|nr:uncharacterized protein CHGG_02009 [Chaetomium globosum CBS 148.51]EAQ93774.1 hypothetical protein CHGG_02009 [Chaetomium globosum CBS 148.51]
MGDIREYSELSEDKTEPFSQGEIQARLQRSRMEEFNTINSAVPLDKLVVPPDDDIRILMRPLARDRTVREDRNVMPLSLRAEAAEAEEKTQQVLAVRQTARDISFTVSIPDYRNPDRRLACIIYYDPASDNQILSNRSNVPFTLSRVSHEPEAIRGAQYQVNPEFHKPLTPGTWRITMGGTDLLDFRLLERRPVRLRTASSSSSETSASSATSTSSGSGSGSGDVVNSSGKRLLDDEDGPINPEKRRRPTDPNDKNENSVIRFLLACAKGKEVVASTGHPLLDLQSVKRSRFHVGGAGCVFTAEYSEAPGRFMAAMLGSCPCIWSPLTAVDLSARGVWRTSGTDLFSGDRSDALRILKDASSGLHYLHSLRLEHNDIKPGNIFVQPGAWGCRLRHGPVIREGRQHGRRHPMISWPDIRAHRQHPRHLYWTIADVHEKERQRQATAVSRMRMWLNEVTAVRNGLDVHDKLERLVHGMLAPNPRERLTTKEIVNQLFVDQGTDR